MDMMVLCAISWKRKLVGVCGWYTDNKRGERCYCMIISVWTFMTCMVKEKEAKIEFTN
jgi:hypothetical protein